jgi:hypothetical protein
MQTLSDIRHVAIGSDSPLTATGDLLDEVRYALRHCNIAPEGAYRMITELAARILRLRDGEGTLRMGGSADLIAIRDIGDVVAERMQALTMTDIQLVIVCGQVQLVSEELRQRLSPELSWELQPIWVGGELRWLRAPVRSLLERTEAVLGKGQVRMSGRLLREAETYGLEGSTNCFEKVTTCGART